MMLHTTQSNSPEQRARVIYLAPDCTDSAVKKRARGFVSAGADLISFSFRRTRYDIDFEPDWHNIELGETTEKKLFGRMLLLLRALRTFYLHRSCWRAATVIYARNLDLAVLAWIGRGATRCSVPLAYEVLDVHPALTRPGFRAKLLRWLERRILARCRLLVVSSPAFLKNYFHPVQRYHGESFLLENKWPIDQMPSLAGKPAASQATDQTVWTIGWFGNIRCATSLDILAELADALPDRVRIYIRGCASLLGERRLMDMVERRGNMLFEGEYIAPDQFSEIYQRVHFNWCVDLDGGENSLWLLPNRLYEGGYFGVPALAVACHETGRIVRKRRLGIVLEPPIRRQLLHVFATMNAEKYLSLRRSIEALPRASFVDDGDISRLLALPALERARRLQPPRPQAPF